MELLNTFISETRTLYPDVIDQCLAGSTAINADTRGAFLTRIVPKIMALPVSIGGVPQADVEQYLGGLSLRI